jgi:hypothetical protein
LNNKGEAFLTIQTNTINWSCLAVKLYKSPISPVPATAITTAICNEGPIVINDCDVPIFRYDNINLSTLPWDISFQHLLSHIDEVSHIKKIASLVKMDIDLVKRSLRMLLFHEVIIIVDIFKFSNVYSIDSDLSELQDSSLMTEMRDFCAIDTTSATSATSATAATTAAATTAATTTAATTAAATTAAAATAAATATATATSTTTTTHIRPNTTTSATSATHIHQPTNAQMINVLLHLQPGKPLRSVLLDCAENMEDGNAYTKSGGGLVS